MVTLPSDHSPRTAYWTLSSTDRLRKPGIAYSIPNDANRSDCLRILSHTVNKAMGQRRSINPCGPDATTLGVRASPREVRHR